MSTRKLTRQLLPTRLFLIFLTLVLGSQQPLAAPTLQARGLHTAPIMRLPSELSLAEIGNFYKIYIHPYQDNPSGETNARSAGLINQLSEYIKTAGSLLKSICDKSEKCVDDINVNNYKMAIKNIITETKSDQIEKISSFAELKSMRAKYKLARSEYAKTKNSIMGIEALPGCKDDLTFECAEQLGKVIVESEQKRNNRSIPPPSAVGFDGPSMGSGAPSGGGISGMAWQTALFTGLADYLVERAGDELALWLIQTFYKDLCQKHPDWFPESCGLLVSVKDPTEELPGEVPGLLFSAAIRKDLERFPVVAVRAAYNARSSVIPLVVELSKKDLTKERLVALLKDFAEKAKLQETCSSDPKDPLCVGIALGVALEYLKDAIQEPTFPGETLCGQVKKGVEGKKVEVALLKIFKKMEHIPPGLKALITRASKDGPVTWSCKNQSPWVDGADASAESARAVLSILEEIQLAYQGSENFRKGTDKGEKALQQFVLDNAGHATEVLIQAAKLDGREALRSAEVVLRAGNIAQNAFLPFVSALLRKDLNKDTWIKLLRSAADLDTLTSACKDTQQRPICMFAAFGVSLKFLVDDVLTKDEFPGNAICTQLQDDVKNGTLKNKLIALFGNETQLPPGLKSLVAVSQDGKLTWSCLAAAPWVDGMDSSAGVPKAAVGLIAELHAMYRGFVEFEKAKDSEKAKALQTLLFANARHASRIVYLATIVDGRPELRVAANGALVAIASTDVIEALFSLFVQLRNGTPPVELLAGLADLSRKSELPKLLCQSPETRNDIACTLVATGTLVAEFGGVSRLLEKERWDETIACEVTRDIALSSNLQQSLNELFGELPPTLTELVKQKNIDCAAGDWHQAESVAKLRALLRTVFELESQINTWRKSGAPPARERVGQLMALLNGVLHAAADLLDQDENARVIKAEKLLTILGDMFNANYVEGVRGSLALLALYKDALPDSIRRYIPLIADLANAQDARGVQNALRAATAPLGSWKRKFSRVTVSVSAIVGGQGGLEMALAKPFGINLQDGLYGGPMAALGLEVGGPVPHGNPRAEFSMSGFLSVIDVGQLALARTTNTGDLSGGGMMPNQQVEASIASNIDLLDVFAPGLYWKFGFKAIPLTFGFGPTFAPRLRKYSYTDADKIVRTADPLSMIRLNMFIGVDLNLFPIR